MSRKPKVHTVAAARRRALDAVAVTVDELTPLERSVAAARAARQAQRRHNVLEQRTVVNGRMAGKSWDELGEWLDISGETLRRRYSGLTEG
jgi:hypothetical protein